MKHLISLSMKYIRRRKLRTLLTYLCVVLSVFILCIFGAFSCSIVENLRNMEKRMSGSWEADFSECVESSKNTFQAVYILKNHAVVDDYLINISESARLVPNRTKNNGKFRFFEFNDGTHTKRFNILSHTTFEGNNALVAEEERAFIPPIDGEGVVLPGWVEKMGYSVGDTITFSVSAVSADFDEDSPEVKAARAAALAETGLPYFSDDPEYEKLSADEKNKVDKSSLSYALKTNGCALDDYPLTNIERSVPRKITLKIAGFDCNDNEGVILNVLENEIKSPYFERFFEVNDIEYYGSTSALVRINENVDFDDACDMLQSDLGFKSDFEGYRLNQELLSLELKSADGIARLVPLAAFIFCFVFLIWALARFIIDNAFEISAAERSTQYAALRVMGASKAQIAAIVFTEAVFYSLTAIPVGCGSAFLLSASAVRGFRKAGLSDFAFAASPAVIILFVCLCLLAIFISAFTSSMWGARKLSPAEALNFGKPRSKKQKKIRRKKSKLNLGSGKFIRRYTMKNIKRTKSRFVISTLTMSIGVTLFTLTLVSIITVLTQPRERLFGDMTGDYSLFFGDSDYALTAWDQFKDNDNFSSVRVSSGGVGLNINKGKTDVEKLTASVPYDPFWRKKGNIFVSFIDRDEFNRRYGDASVISYDYLVENNTALLVMSTYGEHPQYDLDKKDYISKYDVTSTLFDTPMNVGLKVGCGTTVAGMVMIEDDIFESLVLPIESPMIYECDLFDLIVELTVKSPDVHDAAEAEARQFGDKYGCEYFTNMYAFGTGLGDLMRSIIKIAAAVVTSIWLVGILSMINSINTGILNRSRELTMLRSVGMSRKQLRNSVILESIIFSSFSSVIGNAIALVLAAAMLQFRGYSLLLSLAAIAVSIIINVAAAILGAIPGIRSLQKVEAIAKAE